LNNRTFVFFTVLGIAFLLLLGRLFELQVLRGGKYRALAEGNRIKRVIAPAPRGAILDRHDLPLVQNQPVFRKAVRDETGEITSWQSVSREEALDLEARGKDDSIREDVGRQYLYPRSLSHVLGYLGEVNLEELETGNYRLGDLIGRGGVEQQYDSFLRGRDGGKLIEVDANGNQVKVLGEIEPQPGGEIKLSLDAKLSQKALGLLGERKGAVVVSEAGTGRILVLVSSPAFDANLFSQLSFNQEKATQAQAVLEDTRMPMLNRTTGAHYPPASTFKIVSSVAGLEEGRIDRETIYEDTGQVKIGDFVYNNWYFTQYGRVEGEIDLITALKRSTDTFFYKLGEWVGAAKLADWAREFNLGSKTKIDLPGEIAGLVLDPKTKRESRGESWFLGNTYHLAIGQGFLLTTPLQVNTMTSVIANRGKLCLPKINLNQGVDCRDLSLKSETLDLVKEGLKEVCLSRGTAFPFFDFELPGLPAGRRVAGKTGTAEFGDPEDRTHAWFTAYAPVDKPEIVVTVLLEAGGEGSYDAAPIAKEIFGYWFENN